MRQYLNQMSVILIICGFLINFGICSVSIADSMNQSGVIGTGPANTTYAPYVPGELIVKYKDGRFAALASKGMGPDIFKSVGAEVSKDLSGGGVLGLQTLSIQENTSIESTIQDLEESPLISYAEPNYIISIPPVEQQKDTTPPDQVMLAMRGTVSAVSDGTLPNDPDFNQQWGLSNDGQTGGVTGADIHAPGGWKSTTGSDTVVVAVIDTGVDIQHPDLSANIWTNPGEIPGNGIDDDGNGYVDDVHGWDFINNDNDPSDDNGHGTHVAGVIGAVGNNALGVSGVNWKVKIMPLKFLRGDGNGDVAAALNAFAYAKQMGADVISCSWGGTAKSQALSDAISTVSVLVPCAAGNDGSNNDANPHYPSGFDLDQIISVAASDARDERPSFSNYGSTSVDVAAPGDAILSTYPTMMGYSYVKMKGTSMATPYVSGLAALLLSIKPSLSTSQLKQIIIDTVDRLPAFTGTTVSGGRINIQSAITAAGGGSEPVTYSISATSGQWGSISPSGSVSVSAGSSQSFTITPDASYQVSSVIVDNQPIGAVPSFTFSNVQADHTISASFVTQSPINSEVKSLPGLSSAPQDINKDGKYEDINGNFRADFSDVVLFFKNMDWISTNEPIAAFDFSGNGRIDYTDVTQLFRQV